MASFGTRRPTVHADALARNMAFDAQTVAARVAEIASLPEQFAVTVTAAAEFIDPVLAGLTPEATWNPLTRRWVTL